MLNRSLMQSNPQSTTLIGIAAASALALLLGAEPAQAQFFEWPGSSSARKEYRQARAYNSERRPIARRNRDRSEDDERRRESRRRESAKKEPVAKEARPKDGTPVAALASAARRDAASPPEPLLAVISLSGQRLHVYDRSGLIAESRVSTGQAGHRTPAGIYSIIQRNRYHHSNIYSGAPMPWMQRITWSGIAMHAGVVPGYPASHGCIRLPYDFAPKMWSMGRIGTRVVVSPADVRPQEIAHANLPVPAMTPVLASEFPLPVKTASIESAGNSTAEQRLVDPYRFAHIRKMRAQARSVETEKAIKAAAAKAQEASVQAAAMSEALKKAETQLAALEARKSDEPESLSKIEEAKKAVEEAKSAERSASEAAFAAAEAAKQSRADLLTAREDAKLSSTGFEPVSIFVSRKAKRVYLRQGFTPLHDEPIEITEPDRPLGTHVFTAIESKDDGLGLRWLQVTFPQSAAEPVKNAEPRQSRRKAKETSVAAATPALPPSDASGALDRIALPEATKKLIQDRLWPGASLVVSDHPVSNETGRGTDFIIQPR